MCQATEGLPLRMCKDNTCRFRERQLESAGGRRCKSLQTNVKGKRDTYILFNVELGSGTYSHVRLGMAQSTSMQVAVKVVDKKRLSATSQAMTKDEVTMLKTVKMAGCTKSLQLIEAVETAGHLYIVTEFVSGGDLFDYCESVGDRMDEPTTRRIFRKVLRGVRQLHEADICHLDLKLENVMYSPLTSEARICDFGFAKNTTKRLGGEHVAEVLQSTFCGSTHYVAPEICRHHPFDGKQADMWSLGVMLYAMTSGIGFPFSGKASADVYVNIVRQPLDSLYFPPGMSSELISLQLALMRRTSWDRLTVDEALAHPWLLME